MAWLDVPRGATPRIGAGRQGLCCPFHVGRRWRLTGLLRKVGVQQLQDAPDQMQTACHEDTDGHGFLEQNGPAAGHGVRVESLGHQGWQVWVPALGNPLQSMRDARENQGVGIERAGGGGSEDRGAVMQGLFQPAPHLGQDREPRVLRQLGLHQPAPVVLILQAAGQDVFQGDVEILLICRRF